MKMEILRKCSIVTEILAYSRMPVKCGKWLAASRPPTTCTQLKRHWAGLDFSADNTDGEREATEMGSAHLANKTGLQREDLTVCSREA